MGLRVISNKNLSPENRIFYRKKVFSLYNDLFAYYYGSNWGRSDLCRSKTHLPQSTKNVICCEIQETLRYLGISTKSINNKS